MLGYKENYFMALFLKRVKQRPGDRSWALGHSMLGIPELRAVRVPGGLQRGKSGPKKSDLKEERPPVILMIKGFQEAKQLPRKVLVVLLLFFQ